MEITRVVSDKHYRQLQESKPKMTELENKLRQFSKDEGEFNTITHNIFTKTESKKNKIVDKQNKKLNKLTDTRDCYIDHVSQGEKSGQKSKETSSKETSARQNTKNENKPSSNTGSSGNKKPKQRSKKTQDKPAMQLISKNQPSTGNGTSNEQKNEVAPRSTEKSYSAAVKTGQPKQTKKNPGQIPHQTGMQNQLSSVIEQLINCLKVLNGTGGSSALPAESSGGSKRKFEKKYSGVKRRY